MSALMKQILEDAPLAYWPMDESSGTTLNDRTGNGRNMTLTGTYALSQPMAAGLKGVDFNGGYASRASEAWMALGADFTITSWVYPDEDPTADTQMAILARNRIAGDTVGSPPYRMVYFATGSSFPKEFVGVTVSSAPASGIADDLAQRDISNLYQVSMRLTGGNLTSFVNGQPQVTVAAPTPTSTSRELYIARYAGDLATRFWKGKIAHVAVYGTALADSRIRSQYAAGIRTGVTY